MCGKVMVSFFPGSHRLTQCGACFGYFMIYRLLVMVDPWIIGRLLLRAASLLLPLMRNDASIDPREQETRVGSTRAATPAPKLQRAHGHTSGSSTLQQQERPSSKAHIATHLAAAPCRSTSTEAPKCTSTILEVRTPIAPAIWGKVVLGDPGSGVFPILMISIDFWYQGSHRFTKKSTFLDSPRRLM